MAYPPPQQGIPYNMNHHPIQGYPPPPTIDGYPPPMNYNQISNTGPYPPPIDRTGYPPHSLTYGPTSGGYPMPPGPIVDQPMGHGGPPTGLPSAGGWINMPQGPINCPPGLEYLEMVDQLLVHQKVEILEALTGFETNNKFTIKNSLGQKVYYAAETNDCCTRNCCGPLRPFDMVIIDNFQRQVMNIHRPLACDTCCFPCCLQSIEVSAPPGSVLGTVQQQWSLFCPTFDVKNASGDVVLRIEGPCCTVNICGDVEFKIMSSDGLTQVGKISKQWSGLLREVFTDADYFGITFPMDLDIRMKAVMLGACFLIDAMFFEKTANREQRTFMNL